MNKLQISLVTGAMSALIATAVVAAYNPNASTLARLDTLQARSKPAGPKQPGGVMATDNVSGLIRQPIFVMTTGGNAYKDKDFKLFGISITPKRKAALVSVDGAEAHWVELGETESDFTLIDIGTNGARFDTPTGIRSVNLNDGSADATKTIDTGRGG
jgi:hypothetical protein